MTVFVELCGHSYITLWTFIHAQTTPFAPLNVEFNFHLRQTSSLFRNHRNCCNLVLNTAIFSLYFNHASSLISNLISAVYFNRCPLRLHEFYEPDCESFWQIVNAEVEAERAEQRALSRFYRW